MDFTERSNRKKSRLLSRTTDAKRKSGKGIISKILNGTNEENTTSESENGLFSKLFKGSSKDDSPTSFTEWSDNKMISAGETDINSWLRASRKLLNDYNRQAATWHDSDSYDTYHEQINKLMASASNYREQYAGNEEAIAYINDVVNALGKASNGMYDVSKYYAQWETEDDYKGAVKEQKRYEEMMSFDLEAGSVEIDDLEKKLEKAKSFTADDTYYSGNGLGGNVGAQAWNESQQKKSECAKYLKSIGYDSVEDLEAAIAQKKQYLAVAKRSQGKSKLEADALNSEDFERYAEQGASIKNPTVDEAAPIVSIFGWKPGAEEVKNKVTYTRDNYEEIFEEMTKAAANGSSYRDDSFNAEYMEMTDEEVKIYNYYLAKYGSSKADKYLDSLTETLRYRAAAKAFESMKGDTAQELFFSFGAGLDQFGSGMKALFSDEDYIPPSSIQMRSGMVREDLAGKGPDFLGSSLAQTAYDLGTTTSNMLPSIAVSALIGTLNPAVGAATGSALLGTSAAGNAYSEMLNLGYDKDQARAYGSIIGTLEGGLQYVLGGVGKLGGKLSNRAIAKAIEGINSGAAKFAIRYGGEMLSEGVEESLQEILSPIIQNAIFNTDETVDWEQVAYNGLLGALSAGALNSTTAAANVSRENNYYKDVYSADTAEIIAAVLEKDANNKLAKTAQDKLNSGKKLSGREIKQLLEQYNKFELSNDKNTIQRAAAEQLAKYGETGNIEAISAAIAKQTAGEALTRSETKLIEDSKYGQRVANELNPENIRSGEYSSSWAEKLGTNRINAEEYGRLAREAERESVPADNANPYNLRPAEELALEPMDYEEQEDYLRERYAEALSDGTMSESFLNTVVSQLKSGSPLVEMIQRTDAYLQRESRAKNAEAAIRSRYADELKSGIVDENTINAIIKEIRSGAALADTIAKMDKNVKETKKYVEQGNERNDGNGGGVGRNAGAGTSEQSERVPERAGGDKSEERGDDARTEEARRDDSKKPQREKISSKELNIPEGTENKTLTVVKRPGKVIDRIEKAFSGALKSITFVSGDLEVRSQDGDAIGVSALKTSDGRLFIRTDHRLYSAEKLLLHESGHLYFDVDAELRRAMHNAAVKILTEKGLERLANKYARLWWGIYPLPEGLRSSEEVAEYFDNNPDAYREFLDKYEIEIWCDALAGLDRQKAPGASKLSDDVRAIFKEQTGIDVDALLSGQESAETEAKEPKGRAAEVEQHAQSPPGSSYSIETLPDGKKYVRADRQVIFGNDPESWCEQLEDYINGKIRRGKNVQLIAEDGDVLTLTANTAGKIASRYKDAKTMNAQEYERKVNAGTHIDELVRVSTRGKKTMPDVDGRHGEMASGGWNYRTAYFLDFDSEYYRCRISVSIGKDGNAVYNIGEMEERSFPTAQNALNGSSANSGALGREASSQDSIRNSDEVVNSYSVDEDLELNLKLVLEGTFYSDRDEVHIGTTSNFLTREIGAEALELYMPANKAYQAMVTEDTAIFDGKPTGKGINYHGLGIKGLMDILNASENPVAAFADTPSKDNKRENRIVLVTDVKVQGGYGVVIEEMDTFALRNGERKRANKSITAYSKSNIQYAIQDAIADNRILYLDEKRSQARLPIVKGANYPTVGRKADFKDNIRNFWKNVNWKNSGRKNFSAESTSEDLPEWKKQLEKYSENSFSADDAETIARPENGGEKYSKEQSKYDYSKPFAEQIDDWIAGKIPKYDTLIIGATPTAFRKIGFNALPMTINQSHVDYAIYGTKNTEHHIGEALLKQLPSALEQPVAIIASETQKGTSVIALLPFTKDGKTVVAPVYIDGFGIQNTVKIDSNAVTSIYGRKNAVSNLLTKALNDHKSTEPHVFYLDKAKAAALYQGSKVTVPKMPNTSDGFVGSIRDPNSPVKLKIKDVTESRQFKRWFGNSKVINSDGTPKIVYHGTGSDFSVFDKTQQGKNYVQGDGGFFFTTSRKSAENYAKLAGEDGKGLVIEAYLSIQNPYEVTAYGDYVQAPAEKYDDHRSEYLNEAEMQGCDGIIINGEKSSLYVVFEPNQVKSATDNIGTFDSSNPDIRFSTDDAETIVKPETQRITEISSRAKAMGINNLRERVALLDGKISGYERTDNLTERMERELEQLRAEREIYANAFKEKKAKAKKKKQERKSAKKTAQAAADALSISYASRKSRANLRKEVFEIYAIKSGRNDVRETLDAFLDVWMERGDINDKAIQRLEDVLVDLGAIRVESSDEQAREVRERLNGGRISVPAAVVSEFGDEWESFRRRAFGNRIYLSTNPSAGYPGIDQWTMDLAASFGRGRFDTDADLKTQLEAIIETAEAGKAEKLTIAQMADYFAEKKGHDFADQYLDEVHEKLMQALKSFSQSAHVEMMELVKTNVYRTVKRNEELKQRMERAQRERDQRELQNKTLKELQWLKRNQRFMDSDFKEEAQRILADIDTIAVHAANEMNWSNKYNATWQDLVTMYKWAKANDPNFLPSKDLEYIVTRIDGLKLEDMTATDLEAVYKAAVALRTAYYNRNNVIGDALHRQFEELFEDAVSDLKSAAKSKKKVGKTKRFMDSQLNPINRVRRMFGWKQDSAGTQIFGEALEKGERATKRYVEQATQMLDEWLTKNEKWVRKADGQGKDAVWYELEVPELKELHMGDKPIFGDKVKVYMTPMQKVYLYLESKNYDNLRHMVGGRTFVDKELYSAGEYDEAFAGGTTISLAPETVKQIVSNLTTEEMEFANLLDKYFNGYAKEEINRVSNILYGYDRAMNDNYAPIFSNANYTKIEPGVYQDGTAEGVGHMKTRIQGAKNPTYNISALQAFRKHVSQTSRFVGMSIPMQNAKTLLNWKMNGESMQDHITHAWSKSELDALENVMTELQAPTYQQENELTSLLGKAMSNYIGGVFGANITVAAKVLASLPTAAIELGNKYYPTLRQRKNVDLGLIRKYTSELDIRIRGLGSPELAALTLDEGRYQRFVQSHKLTKYMLGGGLLQAVDVYNAKIMWPWAENKVKAEYPGLDVGTDEYYKKVAEVYERAISETQSMYDIMHRSDIMRNTSEIVKSFTIFHTDSLQAANLLRKRAGEYKAAKSEGNSEKTAAAKKALASAIGNVILMNVLVGIFDTLRDLWRKRDDKYRDDEGDFTFWSVTSEELMKLVENASGMIIGLDALIPAVESLFTGETYYEHKVIAIDAFNDIISGTRDFAEATTDFISGFADVVNSGGDIWQYLTEQADYRGAVKDAAEGILHYFGGIPVKNIETLITSALGWAWPEVGAAYDGWWNSSSKGDLSKSKHLAVDIKELYDGRFDLSDSEAEELARLYESGYKTAIIGDAPSKLGDAELDAADVQAYNNAVKKYLKPLSEIMSSEEYMSASDEDKAKMLERLYDYATDLAKGKVSDEHELSSFSLSVMDWLDSGMTWAQIMSGNTADNNTSRNYIQAGVSWDVAEDIIEELSELEPEYGRDKVLTRQKVVAVAYMQIAEKEKEGALKVIYGSAGKSYERYMIARRNGVLTADYADFITALDEVNSDGGNPTKAEFELAVKKSGLKSAAAKEIWYTYFKSQSPWG